MQIYCWATVACLAVLLLALLASRGTLLHRFFFYDVTDTGMDFFHSIEYMRGRMPYGQFDTLYPPLANLFFYVLYLLVPKTQSATWTESYISSLNMRGTERDLRLQQATMMLFVVFVVGGGDPQQYTYILGMPAWYFWVFVVCAVTAGAVSVILDKFFRHMSLEAEGELEDKAK